MMKRLVDWPILPRAELKATELHLLTEGLAFFL